MTNGKYMNLEDIREWWRISHDDVLPEGETVRAVVFKPNGVVHTIKDPIRSLEELENYITWNYNKYQNQFGISVSAAQFFMNKENGYPAANDFSRTTKFILDVDCYVENGKRRVNIGMFDDEWQKCMVAQAQAIVFASMNNAQVNMPTPILAGVTGGGLQLIYSFDRELDKDEATLVFNQLKRGIPTSRLKATVLNPLGSIAKIDLEIDASSTDITHVQRVLGTWHQKHQIMSKVVRGWSKDTIVEHAETMLSRLTDLIDDDREKTAFSEKMKHMLSIIRMAFTNRPEALQTDDLIAYSKINSYHVTYEKSNMSMLEREVVTMLNNGASFEMLRDRFNVERDAGTFAAMMCPFHEGDAHSSFAVYKNKAPGSYDVYADFHDQKKYNAVELLAKLDGISKSEAIKWFIDKAGLDIKPQHKKELKSLASSEQAEGLVEHVNTKDFIYYRLASKQKNCIIRHVATGRSYVFDGLTALARQVLKDQLNIQEITPVLLEQFQDKFENDILIDGFERFNPGKPPVYKENEISIINMWVPTHNYSMAKEKSADYESMSLKESMLKIEYVCPNISLFIRQVVQSGSMEWFVNWLALTSQFKVVPTIPFHFGNYGTGKNLFIDEVLGWFLGDEYVHVVGTDTVTKNFNAFMESASLIVIDESSLYDSKSVDTVKMLSGNKKVNIERKGVDVFGAERHFNFMTFSNREIPAYINTQERRFSFFHNTITLAQTLEALDTNIPEFLENIKNELVDFFAIMLKTKTVREWSNMNMKEGTFYRVVFSGHGFGKLLIAILDNDWDSLSLQLNENISDDAKMHSNMQLLTELRTSFEQNNVLPLPLVNRYIESLNFKNRASVTDFIRQNHLGESISVRISPNGVDVIVDVKSLRDLIYEENVLIKYIQKKKQLHFHTQFGFIDSERAAGCTPNLVPAKKYKDEETTEPLTPADPPQPLTPADPPQPLTQDRMMHPADPPTYNTHPDDPYAYYTDIPTNY